MKILVVHNSYTQPGGEDVVFHAESALLEAHGHEVVRYTADNHAVRHSSPLTLAARTIWNGKSRAEVRALIRSTRPDVMHVHNTFPLMSPAVYHAAQAEDVPVVQTLHNFRLICPNAMLRRDGRICEECIGTSTRWPGVVHGCYRDSRAATAVTAAMITTHRLLGTWRHKIDRYIALSEFAKSKFVQDGCPEDKIVVKPNFVDCAPAHRTTGGDYALFVGRLCEEKGVGTLLRAIERLPQPPRLKIVGQGPLMPADRSAHPNIEWLGQQTHEQTLLLMRGASMLLMPSEWYEGMPLTIVEAFAMGLPVITTRLGTMAEMVSPGVTGLLFPPGDASALAEAITWAIEHPGEMEQMALRARRDFDGKYTPERNYQSLMAIYQGAMS